MKDPQQPAKLTILQSRLTDNSQETKVKESKTIITSSIRKMLVELFPTEVTIYLALLVSCERDLGFVKE
ncbi:hypothetical protein V1478_010874 [Vespula squamosa]|uniref:Uncharacterized protein n=1 Tax=Vespula squamosa TaxID=30214 RepID=A0ABD2AFL4_VESSQ